jgi:hypothetical protein
MKFDELVHVRSATVRCGGLPPQAT